MSFKKFNYEQKVGGVHMPSLQLIANLSFGEGAIGAEGYDLGSPEEHEAFLKQLALAIRPINNPNTANCVDGREIVRFADGNDDPYFLDHYVTHQIAGGTVLGVTKAATAAGLVIVRDAKSFQAAYETMYDYLTNLGFEDGGHAGCGASRDVQASVDKDVTSAELLATLPAIRPLPKDAESLLASNIETKKRLLESGFYDSWSNGWHEDFLAAKVPHNFAILKGAQTPTNGHEEKGLLLVSQAGYGFAKNRFNRITGKQVFAETTHTAPSLISRIGKLVSLSPVEMSRFMLEFDADGPHVLKGLAAKGMPVYAQEVA